MQLMVMFIIYDHMLHVKKECSFPCLIYLSASAFCAKKKD